MDADILNAAKDNLLQYLKATPGEIADNSSYNQASLSRDILVSEDYRQDKLAENEFKPN